MPHKYVTKAVLENLESEIADCNTSINKIRTVSRGGAEAVKELVQLVGGFRDNAREKKDQALDAMMQTGGGQILDPSLQEKAALLCRGQEKAFEIVLDILENPTRALDFYVTERTRLEKELEKMRAFEQRTE